MVAFISIFNVALAFLKSSRLARVMFDLIICHSLFLVAFSFSRLLFHKGAVRVLAVCVCGKEGFAALILVFLMYATSRLVLEAIGYFCENLQHNSE